MMTPRAETMTVNSDVSAQALSVLDSEGDAELAMRFEREALPLLDALYRGALTLTGDRREAETLLGETMMNAYRQFGSLSQSTNLRASLYRLLTNANWRLALAREHPSTWLSPAEVEAVEALPATVITKALQALRQDARMVVYYADVEGFSYAEIADITNRSVSAVISLLYRGRHQLRHVLLACREQAACQSPEATPNDTARARRSKPRLAKSKCAPLQQLSEGVTSADQLDRFDREIVRYVVMWAPHAGGWGEDVYTTFGMTVEQLLDRFQGIIDTSVPRLDRLAKSDRELLDKARQLPRIFGPARKR
jgi:RNA polymerase sigma-70 factor, ECF subfamily